MNEPFREEMRYEYPELTADSVVLDCGGYEGRFAEGICERYGCTVHVLEPVRAFYERTRLRLQKWPKVHVHPFGISDQVERELFRVKGDMTGEFVEDGEPELVVLVPPSFALKLCGGACDLLKLNIEGGEFQVLADLVTGADIYCFRNIQVQWHCLRDVHERWREKIVEELLRTHELTFDHGWVWQNWRVRAGGDYGPAQSKD